MRAWVRRLGEHARTDRKVAIGAATLVALTVLTGVWYLPARLRVRVGEESPRDIAAPRV